MMRMMMKPMMIDNHPLDDYLTLKCPSCDGYCLHQGKVEVFNSKHVTVEGNGWVDSDSNFKNSPNQGGTGILIHFECETCPEKSVLAIYQYKGETRLSSGIVNETVSYDAKS